MRMLVASWYVVPGCSGGWTTVMDLLLPMHQAAFVGASARPGEGLCEGIPVRGLAWPANAAEGWPFANRIRKRLFERFLAQSVRRAFEGFRADIVLCLDERMASASRRAGLPFAMRLHSHPGLLPVDEYDELVSSALFVTGSQPDIRGAVFLPHSVDLSRFEYSEPPAARSVIMTSSLVKAENPAIFVKGTAASGLRGTLVGQGPLRGEMERLCAGTAGRVDFHGPVGRAALPSLLSAHQIGVACLQKGWHTTYQMKVTEYQAAGLFPLVQPWSELSRLAPRLTRTFEDADGLAEQLSWLASHWADTLELRRANRAFAIERYSIEGAREQFDEILRSSTARPERPMS